MIPIRNRDGQVYKAFKGDANARFDVWCLPGGKWVTRWKDRAGNEHCSIVSVFDDNNHANEPVKPHPAARRVLSLRRNDMLAIENDTGTREIVRVVKFSGTGTIQLAAHHEGGALKARDSDPADPFRYLNSSASSLRKARARQIRIDELGRVFDPGPRE